MKFIIEENDIIGEQELIYIKEECSFYMKYSGQKIDIELAINKITLEVSDNKIVDLSGFCGLDKSMKSNCQVPEHKKGIVSTPFIRQYFLELFPFSIR